MSIPCQLEIYAERWPIAGEFRIARGARSHAEVVLLRLCSGNHVGWSECVPYARYGESVSSVESDLASVESHLHEGVTQKEIQGLLAPGAARNALDCAFLHLRSKVSKVPVWGLLGLAQPVSIMTAMTISLDSPERMADKAARLRDYPLLKLKLEGRDDIERVQAVRRAASRSRVIVDANESWNPSTVEENLRVMAELGVEMVEQPLPAEQDAILERIKRPLLVCGDESIHTRADLSTAKDRYDCVNIKLDKTGGLTEAIAMVEQAKALGLRTMVGCMVCTSLGIAPAMLLTKLVDYVDLDGALLLQRDREHGITAKLGELSIAPLELWG